MMKTEILPRRGLTEVFNSSLVRRLVGIMELDETEVD